MKTVIIYLGFFALIAFAMYISQSLLPLMALLLLPEVSEEEF